ncbi:MAG: radical SAM protein [Desulfobacteraceae bacterium]|jgi:radical SAM superfamily enzyme YgiQ (UPF0313 family)
MKILFVTPPLEQWLYFGEARSPYLGYAMLTAYLRQNLKGPIVEVLDAPALDIDWPNLQQQIDQRTPDIVCVGAPSCWSDDACRVFKMVKNINKSIITIAGGIHYTIFPEDTLQNKNIDFVIIGEGEITFLELIRMLYENKKKFSEINGLAYKDGDKIVKNKPRPLIENLDDLPLPAYDIFPWERKRYVQFKYWKDFSMVVSTRGCTGKCVFCYEWKQYNGIFRFKSGQRLVQELEILNKQFHVRNIHFGDDCFLGNKERNIDFFRHLIQKRLPLNWFALVRVDDVLRIKEFLPLMAESGCVMILMGVEFPSDDELKKMKKGIKVQDIKEAFRLAHSYGIATIASVIVGWPDDTFERVRRYAKVMDEINPVFLAPQTLQPLPGSDIWDDYIKEKDHKKNSFNNSLFDHVHPMMPTKYLSSDEVGMLANWWAEDFFSKPGRMERALNDFHPLVGMHARCLVDIMSTAPTKNAIAI